MKTVIVGHRLGDGAPPDREPLDPRCGGAGQRLFELVGMGEAEYAAAFERVNLIPPGREHVAWRQVCAQDLERRYASRRVILLGRAVADALGVYEDWYRWCAHPPFEAAAVVPHPSGRCRIYNDPAERERLRRFMRRAARG